MAADPIYLDFNATTPLSEGVQKAILDAMPLFGNPSSSHVYGRRAREVVEKARRQVGAVLNCTADEIVFTSGGTEANNSAITGAAFAGESRGRHIVTSAVEHPAVLEVCHHLETKGFEVTYLPVDAHGFVAPADLEAAMTDRTTLVTIMHSNNEVGTLQPIRDLAAIARRRGALFHTDASQSIGKVQVDVAELGVDLLTVAGHKLYAPKGVGALYIRSGVQLQKFMHGASHERNLRAGTESTLLIAGLGQACDECRLGLAANADRMRRSRDLLRRLVAERFPSARINTPIGADRDGDRASIDRSDREQSGVRSEQRSSDRVVAGDSRRSDSPPLDAAARRGELSLPNTLSVSFYRKRANELIDRVESRVAVSAGAACHAGVITMMSHVLKAMGVPTEYAVGTIRFSTGRATTDDDVRAAVEAFADIMDKKAV